MMRNGLYFLSTLALAGLLSAGCEAGGRPPPGRDGGTTTDGDTMSGTCVPGSATTVCRGNEAVQCNADGTEAGRTNCADTGQVCVEGTGCAMCRPGSFQCNGNTVESCNATGTGWDPQATCDASAGETCNPTLGRCSSPCADAEASNSYIGCEYWPVTTLNSQLEGDYFAPAIVVSNPQDAPATVTVTGPGGWAMETTVAAGAVDTIELPWVDELRGTITEERSALVSGAAYRVVSTLPVTVYQFNPLEYRIGEDCIDAAGNCDPSSVDPFFGLPECDGECFSFTNDASLLLPTHVMTGNYMVLSWPTNQVERSGNLSASPGFFAVVGVSPEPVTVNIQFSGHVTASADGSVRAFSPGEMGSFTLNQGDVLQIVGGSPPSCTPGEVDGTTTYCEVGDAYDLTGSEVRATGPVQVIAGHNCTFVPYNRFACDHLEQALFPLETWGKESIMSKTQPPMSRAEPQVVRIISGADNNTITFDPSSVGGGSVTLNRGQVLELDANESFQATGTEAFLMGQFIVGQNYLPDTPLDAEGDPALSLGIPSEQFRTSYSFLAPATYPTNYVNVTAPTGATVTLDGSPVSGFSPVGGTGFSTAQVPISSGQHNITSDQPFGIVVYGYGQFTSYMYPGGLDFEEINPLI
jgi:hypothetical protein